MATLDKSNTDQQYLITMVKRRLDQQTSRGQTIGANDEQILEELDDAADEILVLAPYDEELFRATINYRANGNPSNTGDYTIVRAPSDFIRFLSLKLSDWRRPVFQTITPESPRYRQQFDEYQANSIFRPVVAVVPYERDDPGFQYQCFPEDDGPFIDVFEYVASTLPSDMPKQLWDPMVWEATARILISQSEEGAGQAATKARQILYSDQPASEDNES